MSTEKLSVVELCAAAEKLFAHLENSGNSDLEIDVDYYWHVPAEYLEPLNYGLVRLAAVLQRIGETKIG